MYQSASQNFFRIHTFQMAFSPAKGIFQHVFPRDFSLGQVILTSKVLLGSKALLNRGLDDL